MSGHSADKVFAGCIPELYDSCLVPLIFESYATDLARRVAARRPGRVLEVAAGTGVGSRALATALPSGVDIVATEALETLFPQEPPRFLARTPHGYSERETITQDLAASGFTGPPLIETLAARSRAGSSRIPAVAYCEGTPLRNEIESRDAAGLARATAHCADALARRFGTGAVDGKIQAHIVAVEA